MADGEEVTNWIAELIPDADTLYLRVHKQNRDKDGNPSAKAFSPQPLGATGLSTNWSHYADAKLTRQQARDSINQRTQQPKNPADYGIVSMLVAQVRKVDQLSVVHVPVIVPPRNRAHAEIEGIKPEDAEVRVKLGRIYSWCIRVEDPVDEAA